MTIITSVRGAVALGFTVGVLAVVSGCGSASESFSDRLAEELIERASGGSVEVDRDGDRLVISGEDGEFVIDADGDNFTFSGEDGDAQFRTGGDVPDEWAAVLEVFPGAEVLGVFEISDGGAMSQKVSMRIEASLEQVLEYYERSLTSAGFTETSRLSSSSDGDGFAQIGYSRDALQVFVLASDNDGGVDLSVSLMG